MRMITNNKYDVNRVYTLAKKGANSIIQSDVVNTVFMMIPSLNHSLFYTLSGKI